ncbi:putative cinnamyl alcohol dehydrogenase 8D [Triticum urartu]|uniref:cinnamyl-alcohol dehydrogenase n=1 Tax=Triticum urartu TaxID=4572 RepID=M8A8N4_TRIUA|nr:putative cinnamyl alcohol dehydrogenase 8D [Triticum urartu]
MARRRCRLRWTRRSSSVKSRGRGARSCARWLDTLGKFISRRGLRRRHAAASCARAASSAVSKEPAFPVPAAKVGLGLGLGVDYVSMALKDDDVTIKVLFCGICHTDLHIAKNEWGNALYPVVPGHEIVGVVTDAGPGVKNFKAGDTVGVGYFVDSCRSCVSCGSGHENHCPTLVLTSNAVDYDGATTQGGFSDVLVVDQGYVVRVPEGLPLDGAAPLLCAGVTVYSPMMEFGLNAPGKHLGVVGLGGLGHMAVKFGKAFGMTVTVISSSPRKREEAVERLGADAFLVSQDPEQMKAAAGTMDGIIDTVSAGHPIVPLLELLKPRGQLVVVGAPSTPLELPAYAIIGGGKRVAGNLVGSIGSCQAMLDFAGKHGITADVEVVKMDYVNTAVERLERNDVRYRFVIDVAGSQLGAAA